METVYGTGNWRLTLRRGDKGIAILRAETCDTDAVLPEELWGLPVTSLGDRALAPGAKNVPGEKLRVVCGRESGPWDNRRIRTLRLPPPLASVGQYAFYSCSGLESLALFDDIEDFASSAFMNCRDFGAIRLTRTGSSQGTVLWSIVSRLTWELDVTIHSPEGTARLIFPEYYEDFTENEPTHFFNYTIRSAGYPYHNVFAEKKLSIRAFDGLWEKMLSTEHDSRAALKLAWMRLRYPLELSTAAGAAYTAYIRCHAAEAAALALETGDIPGLRMLLSLKALTADELSRVQQSAAENRFTEAVAVLLEARHGLRPAGRVRSFDL